MMKKCSTMNLGFQPLDERGDLLSQSRHSLATYDLGINDGRHPVHRFRQIIIDDDILVKIYCL